MRTVGGDQARCLSCVTLEGGKGTLHLALSSLPSQSLGPRGDPGPPVTSSGPHRASEPGLSVLAQAAQRKGCLRLWRGCAGPSGVLSCPGSALLHQLKRTFLRRVRAKCPGQLETGSSLHPTRRVGLQACPLPTASGWPWLHLCRASCGQTAAISQLGHVSSPSWAEKGGV